MASFKLLHFSILKLCKLQFKFVILSEVNIVHVQNVYYISSMMHVLLSRRWTWGSRNRFRLLCFI